eukprot:11041024-Alexandrium_andersonii.AAC.1
MRVVGRFAKASFRRNKAGKKAQKKRPRETDIDTGPECDIEVAFTPKKARNDKVLEVSPSPTAENDLKDMGPA